MPSRLEVEPVFAGSHDSNAIREYMYNHERNPKRYPLPKPRPPKQDTGPRAEIWAQATDPNDKKMLQALGKRMKNEKEKPPKTFEECLALPGTTTNGEPQTCIDPKSGRRFVEGEKGFYVGKKHYRPKRVRFADEQEADETEAEGSSDSLAPLTMVQQFKHDISGTWEDLKNFNSLPATSSMDKIRYTFTRENRTWSVLACIGVFILVVCLIGGLVYWAQGSSSSASASPVILGGFTPLLTSKNFNNGSYPLISIN